MQNSKGVYVVIDTDDVGEQVGQAVLNDDAESLSNISKSINAGSNLFYDWAESVGGKVISAANDECTLWVPEEALGDLENVRQQYTEQTGFSASAGVGSKLSEAAKALVHAKMNGKDQVVHYSDEVEQSLSGAKAQDAGDQQDMDLAADEDEQAGDVEGDKNDEEAQGFTEDHMEQNGEGDEVSDFEKISGADDSDDESSDSDIDGDTPSVDTDGDSIPEDKEDYDQDGIADSQESHGQIDPVADDLDQDGDVEHEEAEAASDPANAQEYSDGDDYEDEYLADEDPEMQNTIQDQMESGQDSDAPGAEGSAQEEMPDLSEGDISGEQQPAMDGQDPMVDGAPQEQEQLDPNGMDQDSDPNMEGLSEDELKQEIYANLQSFKENKEHLDKIKQENPELYQSMIAMLQSMIEMAKQLGYQPSAPEAAPQEMAPMEQAPAEQAPMAPEQEAAPMQEQGEEEEEVEPKEAIKKSENWDKLSKAYQLIKTYNARVDMAKSSQKGVHDDVGRGSSFRGALTREAKRAKEAGDAKAAYKNKQGAKEFSNRMRQENKKIQPKLPKSEVVKAEPKKK